jgi:hypothetical protein
MFSSHDVVIDAPYETSSVRLLHLIDRGALRGISQTACYRGADLLLRVGPLGGVPGLSKLVSARFLDPVRGSDSTTVSLRWEATGVGGDLFPAFDGDLRLSAEDGAWSRLRLVGSYRPPLGRTGVRLDRAVLGRVADATVRSFVEALARVIAVPPEARSSGGTVSGQRPPRGPTPRHGDALARTG